jgi:hypothetical protein
MTSVMRVPARLIAEHIDPNANQPLKVLDSLFTPEEDAAFALVVLATTPNGNVYTFTELNDMSCKAGFKNCTHHALGNGEQQFVIAKQ